MPHWISERILAIVSYVPAQFVSESSPHFMLVRAMFALLLIVLVVGVIALRSSIARYMRKACDLIVRKR
jgi:threonine/homoserine/homoserine lactone efflux protein